MGNRISGKRIYFIFILLFFFVSYHGVSGQDKKAGNEENIQKLREEIVTVYKTGGKKALLDFFKKNRAKITNKFIISLAKFGIKEKKEEWIKISEILSEETKDKKNIAPVYLQIVKFFAINSDYKRAFEYLDKAILILVQINNLLGQGKAYLTKGILSFHIGDNSAAIEMINKALPFFEKENYSRGQGDVHLYKGDFYSRIGEISKSLEMYEKAAVFFKKAEYIVGQGNVYLRLGKSYFFTGDNIRALETFDKAQSIFEKSGRMIELADVYRLKGDIYLITSESSTALEMYEKARSILETSENDAELGNTYFSMGRFFDHRGKKTKALEMYDKALVFFKKTKDSLGQGNVYLKKGDIYVLIGENAKALEMYDKALCMYEKNGEILSMGNVYVCKGYYYFKIGENIKAHLMYDKALVLFKQANVPYGQANVYLEKGTIYCHSGQYSKATLGFEKALLLYESVGDDLGQGNVYKNMGIIFTNTGDYLKAIMMLDKALHHYKKTKALLGQGNIYFRKGDIFLKTGNSRKADYMYEKALSNFKKIQDYLGIGDVFYSKGVILINDGKNSDALNMLEKARFFYEKAGGPLERGNVNMSKGELYFNNAQYSKALEMYDKALPLFEKVDEPIGQGNVFTGKGDIYSIIGKNTNAIEMYDKALPFYRKAGTAHFESIAIHGKAKAMVKTGKNNEAMGNFEKAITNLESMRMKMAFSDLKRSFWEKVHNQYHEVVLFMLDNDKLKKGFMYAESMRARVFLDRIGEGLVPLEKGLKPELRNKRDQLIAKLSNLSKQMQETGGKEEKKLQELKNDYHKVENEFEELLIKIRIDNPLYASIKYPEPVSLRDIRKGVLKKGEILLRYFVSPDTTYVFLISKKSFKVLPIKIKAEKIKSHVNLYLEAVEDKTGDVEFYGKILYRELFKPIEEKLKKHHNIIIVPDGHLEKIPFEALITGENDSGKPVYLVEKYRLKYVQSASILSVLRKYYQRDRESYSFVGFGDPVYDYEKYANVSAGQNKLGSTPEKTEETNPITVGQTEADDSLKQEESGDMDIEDEVKEIHRGRYERAGGKLPRLIGSGEEVRSIVKLFENKEQKAVLYSREQATETRAKSANLKEFDFIHFACHGLLNDDFQSLVLSQDIPGAKDDGYFTLNEIMNCNYYAKLVVLSACETGAGKMEKGEGVTGLTRAVMYAGTPAVVASLWKVDDKAAKELMVRFYKNLLEKNMSKTEALRKAKLDLLKSNVYSSPVSWSAFVLYGE